MVRTLRPGIATLDMRTVAKAPLHERLRGRKGIASRKEVLADEPLCRRCDAAGIVALATEVDHIVPLAKGGSNARSNLQGMCGSCHDAKTAEDFAGR